MRRHLAKIFVALFTIFSLNAISIPTTALDLGAKGTYIISINPSARANVESAINKSGWNVKAKFQYAFDGFSVELPKVAATALSKVPNVLSIEEDQVVTGLDVQSPTPSWGLDRIDQAKIPLNSSYTYGSNGSGATIYIADTGIYPHNDLLGRISSVGYTYFADGRGTVDCNGHGTHVSGTAAGTNYGVAKNANLVPVRILDCNGSGSYTGVIAGLDWILSPANTNPKTAAVVSMSIGGPQSSSLNSAVARLTSAGINVVVAAGNENTDACTKSPASAPSAITVGATTSADSAASYSNQGSCIDIFAPGSGITSSWYTSATATNTISGTSMATPHVSGAVALYLGLYPTATVAQVTSFIDSQSTQNALTNIKTGTVNKMLYVSPTLSNTPEPIVSAPSVTIGAASNITNNSATLNGQVSANNADATVKFQYSTSSSYTSLKEVVATPATVTGSGATAVSANISGLSSGTTYYFR